MNHVLSPTTGLLLLALFGVAAYALTALFIRHKIRTKVGFLVADRDVGWKRAALSIAAAWIWAPALFVAAQQGYQNGWVGVFWFTVPNVAVLVIFAGFAHRMRQRYPDGFTWSGYVRDRLSQRTHRVYFAAFLGLAVCSFAVQLLAGGLIIEALTGIPFVILTLLMALAAITYSLRSGLGASIITDAGQMILIAVVVLVIAPLVAFHAGAPTMVDGLLGVKGNMDSLISGPGAGVFWSYGLVVSIALLSGPFGDQSFWQRAWAVEAKDVRKAFYLGAAVFAIVPLTMSLLGFAAAGAGLKVANPQLTNLSAVLHWLPSWTAIPFALMILGGLVSTLDSNLSSVGALSGHDLTNAPANVLRNARIGMVALAVGGIALANVPGLTIIHLQLFYGTLRAATLIPTVMLVRWRHPVHEQGVFYGVLGALLIALPMSAYGNLTKTTPWILAGSIGVLLISGGVTWAVSKYKRSEALVGDRRVEIETRQFAVGGVV